MNPNYIFIYWILIDWIICHVINIFINFILLGTYNGDIRSPLVHENINRFLVRIFRHSNQQISTLGGGNKYELDNTFKKLFLLVQVIWMENKR